MPLFKSTALLFLLFILIRTTGYSQSVGINTEVPHPSAVLEVKSGEQGVLFPRMTNLEMTDIDEPAEGLIIIIGFQANLTSSAIGNKYGIKINSKGLGNWAAFFEGRTFMGEKSYVGDIGNVFNQSVGAFTINNDNAIQQTANLHIRNFYTESQLPSNTISILTQI